MGDDVDDLVARLTRRVADLERQVQELTRRLDRLAPKTSTSPEEMPEVIVTRRG
jgi:hypothetical protein